MAKHFLCNIFYDIITKGGNSSAVKESVIVLIPKANGISVRPISLMLCMLKTLERIIKLRSEWWSENRKIFLSTQLIFRRGMGTQDCIAHLVTDIQLTFSNNEYMAALFLDIVSAYDNVDLHILYGKLITLQIPSNIACSILKLLTDRKVYIRCGSMNIGPRTSARVSLKSTSI